MYKIYTLKKIEIYFVKVFKGKKDKLLIMSSEYFRMRMLAHDQAISKIEEPLQKITGKKRSYSEAMGKDNDYNPGF